MTAEVSIMNKHGMSMAADSAITSGFDGVPKVYNSANKLFPLSKEHPIGFMVYGSASFMEIPWEVIIKSYRDYLGNKHFNNVQDYFDDLMDFLRQDSRFKNEELEDIIVYRTFSDLLKQMIRRVETEIEEDGDETDDERKVRKLLEKEVDRQTKAFLTEEALLEIDYKSFEATFFDTIQEIKDEYIEFETSKTFSKKLCRLAFESVKNDFFSRGSTGFVIAGYGEEEIFPHLLNYRLEGFVLGTLKYKLLKERKIDYRQNKQDGTAVIEAFAQREMVDSFMVGIEPHMEETMFGIIDRVLSEYPEQIQRHLGIDLDEKQVSNLKEMGNELYHSIKDALDDYQKRNYLQPLLGIVRSLPKDELANMAETLMNLTSFKRKLTRATESVGPPIDVAVISKGDGFVWVKRKSYFNKELNE
ncbi:hypothetical protein ACFFJI_03460 [Allobacillus sp. GCM10007491]|uniref:Uncharacterized protein n=1 Tax=Allobacillus saliphilus TaxID=2912308 RepID=A0A941HSR0_9BACI|nr:hypothetical protein [Allobacillus saliphilus]MBR7553658.1 hypothetical protein [Allobacillus saliphilus]